MKPGVCGVFILTSLAFAACGGGGGSNSGVAPGGTASVGGIGAGGGGTTPTPVPSVTSTATPTPAGIVVSGTAQEYASGAALAGFTLTIGAVPTAATCLNAESATAMPCGVPASPQPTITTSPTGAFSVGVPAAGTYMLTIGKDATYATLHRTITVTAGTPLTLGTVKVAALSTDEQAWLIDVNNQRATVSVPTSFANLVVDEYAEEQARAEVAAIVSGAQPYGDATEALFSGYYATSPGAMYQGAGVADLIGAAGAYIQADANWMGEKANCNGGNWLTCSFQANTGHYIALSNTENVWAGVAESKSSFLDAPYGSEWAYAIIFPTNYETTYPTGAHRVVWPPTK
jgi:hypothetical protein